MLTLIKPSVSHNLFASKGFCLDADENGGSAKCNRTSCARVMTPKLGEAIPSSSEPGPA